MNHQMIKHLTRNPNDLINFNMTGRTPNCKLAPSTPLRDLIQQIPPRMRILFKGVTINPALGFNCSIQFHTLAQALMWLGDKKQLIGNKRLPYMAYQIRGFKKELTVQDIINQCAQSPSEEVIAKHIPKHIL